MPAAWRPFFRPRGSEASRRPGLDHEVTELVAGPEGFEVGRIEDPGDLGEPFKGRPDLPPSPARRSSSSQGYVCHPTAGENDDLGPGRSRPSCGHDLRVAIERVKRRADGMRIKRAHPVLSRERARLATSLALYS